MKSQVRNYRMFKKRIAEMDLYQEYRRSHERVKVMLSEKAEDFPETPVSSPSAQDNLRNFIKQHEVLQKEPETEILEQNYVNLAQDTVVNSFSENQEFVQHENMYERSFTSPPNDFQEPLYSDHNQDPGINTTFEAFDSQKNYQIGQFQAKGVEDELDYIIRDALYNIHPTSKDQNSNVDPELLKIIKEYLIQNNVSSNEFNFLNETSAYVPGQNSLTQSSTQFNQSNIEKNNNSLSNRPNTDNLKISNQSRAESFEKQLQDQQAPPKLPKSTVKRPSSPTPLASIESPFSSLDFEDDSSLALTKQELSQQVKNLIKDTLEDNKTEASKPNDLLELERQLKEHIEKIKQSRK